MSVLSLWELSATLKVTAHAGIAGDLGVGGDTAQGVRAHIGLDIIGGGDGFQDILAGGTQGHLLDLLPDTGEHLPGVTQSVHGCHVGRLPSVVSVCRVLGRFGVLTAKLHWFKH